MKNLTKFLLLFVLTKEYLTLNFLDEEIVLPPPVKKGGKPFYDLLMERKTQRDFKPDQEITLNELSQALWVANGVNRPGGERVVPSGNPKYSITIYVFLKKGVYTYDPMKHILTKVKDGDFRKDTGTQDYVANACVNFAYVCDLNTPFPDPLPLEKRRFTAHRDASLMSQDVYLYCASEGFKCVVRGAFDNDHVLSTLGLDPNNYYVSLTFSIGK